MTDNVITFHNSINLRIPISFNTYWTEQRRNTHKTEDESDAESASLDQRMQRKNRARENEEPEEARKKSEKIIIIKHQK